MKTNIDVSFVDSKNDIKRKIETGGYSTLVDIVLDKGIGAILQKLTRTKANVPYWTSSLVVLCVTLLIGVVISALNGEFSTTNPTTIYFTVWLGGMGFLWIVCAKISYNLLLNALGKGVIDHIALDADLKDIQKKLTALSNIKLQILLSVFLGLIALAWPFIWNKVGIPFIGFGPITVLVLIWLQTGPGVYMFILYLGLATGLNRYQFAIQTVDARSSEVIEYLSAMFNGILLIGSAILAAFTIGLAFFQFLGIQLYIVWVLGGWGILLLLFFNNQYILTGIIKRHKQKILREIQIKIHSLETDSNIGDKETLESVNRLLDYYDRIERMPNSALQIGEIFRLIQALLFPIITALLSGIKQVIEIFSK